MARITASFGIAPHRTTLQRLLPNKNLSLMMLTPKDIEFLRGGADNVTEKGGINLGDIIILPDTSIEEMTFSGILFKVIGTISTYKGVNIDSYILKEVLEDENGEFYDAYGISKRNKLTLNRHMCSLLGITYERGLEIWPNHLNFIKYEDFMDNGPKERELDYSNMGTYPHNVSTGVIDKICVEAMGFAINSRIGEILTPFGERIGIDSFLNSVTFKLKLSGLEGNLIPFRLISPCEKPNNTSLYFELDVSSLRLTPIMLEGLNVDNLIDMQWHGIEELRNLI